jgi:hypothetical protein
MALIVNSGPVLHAAMHDISWWFEAIVVAVPPGLGSSVCQMSSTVHIPHSRA